MTAKAPYLIMAVLCDTVIEGKDGVLSLIRVIDRFTLALAGPAAPESIPSGVLQTSFALAFKGGGVTGEKKLRMTLETPSGRRVQLLEQSLIFPPGATGGVNLTGPMKIRVDEEGIFWIDVELDGELRTRMQLQVIYERRVTPPANKEAPTPRS